MKVLKLVLDGSVGSSRWTTDVVVMPGATDASCVATARKVLMRDPIVRAARSAALWDDNRLLASFGISSATVLEEVQV